MCIACELNFWAMIDALPDDARERILRDRVAQFACEAQPPADAPQPAGDERAP